MNRSEELQSINPNTGEILGAVPTASVQEASSAVRRARAAQRMWANLPLDARSNVLKAFQEALADRTDEIADLVSEKTGKMLAEALFEKVFSF
jgi:acyl-CoA reductase-like NAD-dependent aldehyde dehydrogenase